MKNADKSIELKRIVIERKNEGLGREAVQLVKKIVFENLGAHRLWLEAVEDNERAIHVYLSEGFITEGVHRESLKKGKHFLSMKVISILEHEYNR